MSAITSLSLNDGTAAVSFTPSTTNGNSVSLHDRSASTSMGQGEIILAFNPKNSRRPTDRLTFWLNLPYEHDVDGVATVKDVARAKVEVVIPTAIPASERTRLGNLLQSLLADANVQKYITDLEPMY